MSQSGWSSRIPPESKGQGRWLRILAVLIAVPILLLIIGNVLFLVLR